MGYSPVDRAKEIEEWATQDGPNGQMRKYFRSWSTVKEKSSYKFRATNYYGGSACADVVGCNIDCAYCWVEDKFKDPNIGEFLGPKDVIDELLWVAQAKNLGVIRLTGGEPTIGREHLLRILEIIRQTCSSKRFILETNGILLGHDPSYAKDLKKYRNFLHVRVSLKGATPEKFALHTGASPEFFDFQKKALFNCLKNEIDCHPVVMFDLIKSGEELEQLVNSLRDIGLDPQLKKKVDLGMKLEFERLFLYPYVVKRFNERNIPYDLGD